MMFYVPLWLVGRGVRRYSHFMELRPSKLSKKGRTGQRLISLDCMSHRTESESQSPSPQKVLELSIHPQPTEISKRSFDSILSWAMPFNTPSSPKLLLSEQFQISISHL